MCKRNKFVAFLMVLCMMLTMFGGTPEKEAYASEVQAVTMQEKMDYFLYRVGADGDKKVYFTVNQKPCLDYWQDTHPKDYCANCHDGNVVESEWFKEIFGKVNYRYFPTHDVNGDKRNYVGYSCFGFACFFQWYLYADDVSEDVIGKREKAVSFNKENMMQYAQPGDVIRCNGHSAVVYSVEEDGVWVVDSNWNENTDDKENKNCQIQKHLMKYTLSRYSEKMTYINRPTKASEMKAGQAGLFDMESYVKTEPTVLKYGDSGQQVQYFQQNLNFLGYSVGTADGEYGNLTKTAVSNLQTALHMDQTGTVKEGLYDLVYGVISEVQSYLKVKGYYSSDIDGISGSGTQTAMKKLQKEWGNGQTGVLTVTLLERMLSDTSVQISKANIREYVGRMKGESAEDTPTPNPNETPKTYGTLDLSTTSYNAYNVGLDAEMYADKAYTIYHGAALEILDKVTNSKGNEIYHVYSPDLGMKCYVSAKYVKITTTPTPSDPIDAFVTRMYSIILEREPDAGSATWVDGLKDGSFTGVRVADGFVLSEEMLNKDISNEEFVKILYRAFFGREADAEGLATWKGLLDAGCKKTYVFAGFANSSEFGNLCAEAGIVQGRAAEYLADRQTGLSEADYKVWCFVERMYMEVLNRTADEPGVRSWVGALQDGSMTGVEVADGFIMSEEFLAKEMSNEAYVRIMYRAFFGRDADPEGLATWTNALATGWTKQEVFAGFANSNEFGVLCEQAGIVKGTAEGK